MLIAVAGPYSAPTEAARQRNLAAMNRAAAEVYNLGHIPVIGVNAALPVVDFLGVSEPERYEAIMAISLGIVDKCDAILIIGESPGVTRECDLVRAKRLPVYNSISEISAITESRTSNRLSARLRILKGLETSPRD